MTLLFEVVLPVFVNEWSGLCLPISYSSFGTDVSETS